MAVNRNHLTRPEDRAPFRIVVVAGSAGGIQALQTIVSRLPPDFPLPIAIVQHRRSGRVELLSKILARSTTLPVKVAVAGEALEPGTIYVAPADRHLLIAEDATLALRDGHRIRYVFSSADPLFQSAAAVFGAGVIAVVLSGADADGADGARAIGAVGGVVIAQDAATSQVFEMPRAAIKTGSVDYVLPVDVIGAMLVALATGKLVEKTADGAA